jgi:ParB family chromosome partitioning protein
MKAKERQRHKDKNIFLQNAKGNSRDKVAEKLKIGSGKQYEKAKFILDNADDELIVEGFIYY